MLSITHGLIYWFFKFNQTRLSFNRRQTPTNRIYRHAFCSCDFDFHSMTLIHESDLDMRKTYLHTKNELSQGFRKVSTPYTQTDTRTDVTDNITTQSAASRSRSTSGKLRPRTSTGETQFPVPDNIGSPNFSLRSLFAGLRMTIS